MALYLVESYSHEIEHHGRTIRGVVGKPLPSCDRRSEKLYLHVVDLGPAEVAKMAVRIDDDGNKEHDRWSLPKSHFAGIVEWWVAVEGGHGWPSYPGRPLCSTCTFGADHVPRPKELGEDELTRLRGLGADLPAKA